MNKNGFTLIELLAVIVILAIIALISVPIVLNIIRDARKSSEERSVELYATAVKTALMKKKIIDSKAEILGTFNAESTGRILTLTTSKGTTVLNVEYDGEVYCKSIQVGSEVSNKNDYRLYLNGCIVSGSNNTYQYTDDEGAKIEIVTTASVPSRPGVPVVTKKENIEPEGITTVYFNVQKGMLCNKAEYEDSYNEKLNDFTNSLMGYNGINKTGQVCAYTMTGTGRQDFPWILRYDCTEVDATNGNGCLKFYKIKDDESTQTLILDHDTSWNVLWSSSNTEKVYLLGSLKDDTDKWNGTLQHESYSENYDYVCEIPDSLDGTINGQLGKKCNQNIFISYEGYKARLLTKEELYSIQNVENIPNFEYFWMSSTGVKIVPEYMPSPQGLGVYQNNAIEYPYGFNVRPVIKISK